MEIMGNMLQLYGVHATPAKSFMPQCGIVPPKSFQCWDRHLFLLFFLSFLPGILCKKHLHNQITVAEKLFYTTDDWGHSPSLFFSMIRVL